MEIGKDQQTLNAIVLRDETKAGANNELRIYNLLKDLIDSSLNFQQVQQGIGVSVEDTMSQKAISDLVSGAITIQAGEPIGSPRVIMVNGGQAFLFDPTNEANFHKAVGVSINSVNAGDQVSLILSGKIITSGLVTDEVYYAGVNGTLTTIVPVSGILLKVGYAIDSTTLSVEFDIPIILG